RGLGIDPQFVIVVPARLPLEHAEGLPAVARFEERHVGHVHDVRVRWIHGDTTEIPAAAGEAGIAPGDPPRRAAIVGALQPCARLRADQGLHAPATGDRESDATDRARRKTVTV